MTRLLSLAALLCLVVGLLWNPSVSTDRPPPGSNGDAGGVILARPAESNIEIANGQGGYKKFGPGVTPARFNGKPEAPLRLSKFGFQALVIEPDQVEWGKTYTLEPGLLYYPFYRPVLCVAPVLALLALLSRKKRVVDEQIAQIREEVPQGIGEGSQVGPYRLVRRLGQGAMAEVFLGEDAQGQAAVKILHPQVSESGEFRTRFEREIGMCAKLDHPRIIKTYDWGVVDSRYWMAQAYLPGSTLQTWVKPSGMHARDVRKILIQICEGLDYAHQNGVFHRDLKPENILLTSRGEPVIADFGMARSQMYETITHTEAILGTPAFMAPEQAQGHRVDGRADLYAVGIIAFELLTGRLPFVGEPLQVLIAQIQDSPPRLREFQENIPQDYEDLVLKLLSKNPDHRYQSAHELIGALQAL